MSESAAMSSATVSLCKRGFAPRNQRLGAGFLAVCATEAGASTAHS
jgi:hypothetical protein